MVAIIILALGILPGQAARLSKVMQKYSPNLTLTLTF